MLKIYHKKNAFRLKKNFFVVYLENACRNKCEKAHVQYKENEKMAVPKRKSSRMQRRQRKAANRYEGVQATYCPNCNAPVAPHRVCPVCGKYDGKQILTVSEE